MYFSHPFFESVERGIGTRAVDGMGMHDCIQPGGKKIGEFDLTAVNGPQKRRDMGGVITAPVRSRPSAPGGLPQLKNGGLSAKNAAWLVNVALFGVIKPGQLGKRNAPPPPEMNSPQ